MKKLACVIVALLLVGAQAEADEHQMTPEKQQQMLQMQMEMMSPMIGMMVKGMMETMFDFLAKPETAEKLAVYTRNYYDALIKKGFSEEEALRIVTAIGFPAMPGIGK